MNKEMIVGIVMELNPLHNGHKYLIEKIKNDYPNTKIVVITSGYFTMRGEVSILSKDEKVKQLLKLGIDLILELPIDQTLNSAEIFAEKAINILSCVGITHLAFGTENASIDEFLEIVKLTKDTAFNKDIKEKTKTMGLKLAFSEVIKQYTNNVYLANLTSSANNVLGIEYLKAIENKSIKSIIINRIGNDESDESMNSPYPSGTALRKAFYNNIDINNYIPYSFELLNHINEDILLKHFLSLLINQDFYKTNYHTKEGIENYIFNSLNKLFDDKLSLNTLIDKLANKKYTKSRIRRQLLILSLSIKNNESKKVRILGFNNNGINLIKKNSDIEFFSSLKDADVAYYDNEIAAATLYSLITNKDYRKKEFLYPIKEEIWKN